MFASLVCVFLFVAGYEMLNRAVFNMDPVSELGVTLAILNAELLA